MAINYDLINLGKTLGQNIKTVDVMNQQVFESEGQSSLNIVGLSTVQISTSLIVSSLVYSSVFTINHPVYGIVGSTMSPIGSGTILSSGLIYSRIN